MHMFLNVLNIYLWIEVKKLHQKGIPPCTGTCTVGKELGPFPFDLGKVVLYINCIYTR